jgi:hypothetical protein
MRTTTTAQPHIEQNLWPGTTPPFLAQILLAFIFAAGSLLATAQQTATHKPVHHQKRTSSMPSAVAIPQPASASTAPIAPKPPVWPANDRPTEATVVWNSQGLRIEASNSSLRQILKDVAAATGAKVDGLGLDQHISDQRIFGSYGPGNARDVLIQLLDGSGYNLLLIGDQGQGTPREIVLSAQTTGAAPLGAAPQAAEPPGANDQSAGNGENADADDQTQPQPPSQVPPNMRNGFAPGAPPRTPQQIMQEMQQRQQQLLQGDPPQ